jgi:hypothetical protein
MASKLFHTLEFEAFRAGITPRTAQSRDWFMNKAKQLGRIRRDDLMREEPIKLRNQHAVGSMYMYFYDPKHKKALPYYDSFPLVIVIGPAEGGFLGLNLHYLPPILRAKFLDALLDTASDSRYNEATKFNLTYKLLKSATKMKYFKPCVKHYLTSHLASRLAKVEAPEWEIAVFLPTQDFQKMSATKVWAESRKMVK